MIQYLLYRLAQLVAQHLPPRFVYWMAARIADGHFLFSIRSRRQVYRNFSWIYDGAHAAGAREAREVFRNFGRYLADFLILPQIDREAFLKRVRVLGLDHVERAFREGKGVIGVTAHLGNWEWGGVGLSLLGYPVHAMVQSHTNPWVNRFFVNQRIRKGVRVIPRKASPWKAMRILLKNEMLLLAADREFTGNGLPVSFMGRKVHFPKGPAMLALRRGSPLVMGFLTREEETSCTLTFEPPIFPERTADHARDLRELTQKIATTFEKMIRRHPTQWFLFQGLREDRG